MILRVRRKILKLLRSPTLALPQQVACAYGGGGHGRDDVHILFLQGDDVVAVVATAVDGVLERHGADEARRHTQSGGHGSVGDAC